MFLVRQQICTVTLAYYLQNLNKQELKITFLTIQTFDLVFIMAFIFQFFWHSAFKNCHFFLPPFNRLTIHYSLIIVVFTFVLICHCRNLLLRFRLLLIACRHPKMKLFNQTLTEYNPYRKVVIFSIYWILC